MKSKYILNYCTLIIFISLIFSLIYGNYNLKKFDKNIITENNKSLHLMIKNECGHAFPRCWGPIMQRQLYGPFPYSR